MESRSYQLWTRILFAVVLMVCIIALTHSMSFLTLNYPYEDFKNYVHFPIFIAITLSLFFVLPESKNQIRYVTIIAVFLAFFTEFLQIFTARDSDISDVLLNCAGIYITIVWLIYRKQRIWKIMFYLSFIILFGIVGSILYDFIEIEYAFSTYQNNLPVIADFEKQIDLIRIQEIDNAEFNIVPFYSSHGNSSLQLNFTTNKYPGITIQKVADDITNYNYIEYSVFNPENDTLNLINRFDLQHAIEEPACFYHKQQIYPGLNTCKIQLAPFFSNLNEKKVQLTKVYFFLNAPKQPHCLYIDHIRFE